MTRSHWCLSVWLVACIPSVSAAERTNIVLIMADDMGYIDYHKKRDRFFSGAVPEAASDSGYEPTVKGNFK